MTDQYEDLILRLYHSTERMAHLPCSDMELWNEHSSAVLKAADAIKELEADLAAARAAICWAWGMRDDLTREAQAAIEAARRNDHGQG